LFRAIIVPFSADTLPMLEMLLEVCDSSMTYRSRYFTVMQPAPVLDLLMNDPVNPRSLAFQIADLSGHCNILEQSLHGAEWPAAKQKRVEEAAAALFEADVQMLCQPGPDGNRGWLDSLLATLEVVLPAFSDSITNTWFSHAEMERPT
ncbi:MAG: alpha-E domain-containing protein, partial [Acidobacteriota bacterium]|nr:alpha-E domain-containing protein [Acidobacteriota bacterium]